MKKINDGKERGLALNKKSPNGRIARKSWRNRDEVRLTIEQRDEIVKKVSQGADYRVAMHEAGYNAMGLFQIRNRAKEIDIEYESLEKELSRLVDMESGELLYKDAEDRVDEIIDRMEILEKDPRLGFYNMLKFAKARKAGVLGQKYTTLTELLYKYAVTGKQFDIDDDGNIIETDQPLDQLRVETIKKSADCLAGWLARRDYTQWGNQAQVTAGKLKVTFTNFLHELNDRLEREGIFKDQKSLEIITELQTKYGIVDEWDT